jgi:hypothetical protein
MTKNKIPSIEYFEDTNTLVMQLSPGPGVGAREIAEGVIATFDASRRLVGIELLGDVAHDYPELVAAAERDQRPTAARKRAS